jgi:hypothetical protein
MRSPKRRHGTLLDRVLAIAFVAFFLYLVYLAMTGRLDDEVMAFARWLERLFT